MEHRLGSSPGLSSWASASETGLPIAAAAMEQAGDNIFAEVLRSLRAGGFLAAGEPLGLPADR